MSDTKLAALVARLNEETDAHARWTFEGSIPFGEASPAGDPPPRLLRFLLGNGLRLLVLVDKSAPVLSYFT